MANPSPVSYSSPVGKVGGGREVFPNASLDLIAAAPENSWVQLNSNTFKDCWAPAGLRTVLPPKNLFRAWSSFAWDKKRHGFWLWGGGHANYEGNEVYFWSAVTRIWSLAFHTSTVKRYSIKYPEGHANYNKIYSASDGAMAPLSAHTYDNNIYLPILDRFLTFGGAGQGLGRPFEVFDDNENTLRRMGAYTLQLDLAGQGFLGGLPGLNYKGAGYESASLPGARAWEPRDWLLDNASYIAMNIASNSHVNGGTVYTQENGHDVLYWTRLQVSSRGMVRTEFVDHDYRNDIHTKLNNYNDAGGGQGVIALDPTRKIILELIKVSQTNIAQAYDIDAQQSYKITAFNGTAEDVADFYADLSGADTGLDFDPVRGYFVAWDKGPRVWRIDAPTPLASAGWTVTRLNSTTSPAPVDAMLDGQTGTLGKWEYAPDMDCFVGAIEPENGHVWAFKPANWKDPRISNG